MLETNKIHCIDALSGLKQLPEESIQCVVTSPPYWGLRDYGVKPLVWNGRPGCRHKWDRKRSVQASYRGKARWQHVRNGRGELQEHLLDRAHWTGEQATQGVFCRECQAWRGCLGLEPTPELYVQHIVEIFREVRRVLRSDGTLWLNMGDTFYTGKGACNNPGGGPRSLQHHLKTARAYPARRAAPNRMLSPSLAASLGMKPKDLVGMPWAVAFALRADGWYLRSDIVWAKPNPMPESVRDRPTKSHEYLFLLTRAARYFYDAEAVKNTVTGNAHARGTGVNPKAASVKSKHHRPRQNAGFSAAINELVTRRNLRSVWGVPTQPYPGAHFATFPEQLVERCIKAGTSEKGCCPECGAPWTREIHRRRRATRPGKGALGDPEQVGILNRDPGRHVTETATVGWKPTCTCPPQDTVRCLVLDPFAGAGTTAVVAKKLARAFIGFELNPDYVRLAENRVRATIKNSVKGGRDATSGALSGVPREYGRA